jgi:hypothetical protein
MSIKLKKNCFIVSFSIVLFSLISIGVAQAGCVTIKVVYNDGCPRSGADVKTIVAPNNPQVRYICTTGEDGQCSRCDYLEPGDYKIQAWYSSLQFGPTTYLDLNESGYGTATIPNQSSPYPNGTESCEDSECDGLKYCYAGSPSYVECDSWNTECDTKKCCQCNGGTIANPKENYNETQDSDCQVYDCDPLDTTCRDYNDVQYCKALDECADANEDCNSYFNMDTSTLCNNEWKCSDSIFGGDNMYGAFDFRRPSQGYCDGQGNCDWSLTVGSTCSVAPGDASEGTGITRCDNAYPSCRDTCSDGIDNDNNGCTDSVDHKCGGTENICNDNIDNDCDGKIDCVDLDCAGKTGPLGNRCCQSDSDCINEMICNNFICKDITPPQWSNNNAYPPSPAVYLSTATYTFNITWTDNIAVDEVILEMDGFNYSKSGGYVKKGEDGKTYNMTFSTCTSSGGVGGGKVPVICSMDPITPWIEFFKFLLTGGIVRAEETPCLGIGTHYYRWYANDTSNNWNSTSMLTYTILALDPVYIDIISPENKTYSSNTVDIKYTISSPFDISWLGYSLDNKPNVTLTGNTTANVAVGSHNMIFYVNTTYGIMNSSQRIYFTVSIQKPDLIVEDIWNSGSTIYYKIKNQGTATAGYTYSNLYVDGYYKMYDYVSSLSAGYSSNEYFSYSWSCSGTSDSIKVCADGYGYVSESDENNNCRTETWNCPTTTTTTTIPCTCTNWEPTFTCCYSRYSSKEYWTRTCTPSGCAAQSKCEGFCFV